MVRFRQVSKEEILNKESALWFKYTDDEVDTSYQFIGVSLYAPQNNIANLQRY